ncbi:MAG: hypothetical protein KDJ28_16875 [Candidatus Competibacteraceae bacterium]|nr:hypothetical protein [Candidatus Competibacteraceae bacterium]
MWATLNYKTQSALEEFQTRKQIAASKGVADAKTQQALARELWKKHRAIFQLRPQSIFILVIRHIVATTTDVPLLVSRLYPTGHSERLNLTGLLDLAHWVEC